MPIEQVTAGGLILTTNAQIRSNQAVVVCTGKGLVTETGVLLPPLVAQGQHVVAAKNAGQDIKLEGEEYWLVREHDIMYIVEHEEDQ